MTTTEWRIVKFLTVLVVLAASVPAGALFYRLLSPDVNLDTLTQGFMPVAPTAEPTAVVQTDPAPSIIDISGVGGTWADYAVSDQGFAIAIPDTWQRLPMNPTDLNALLATTRAQNPELANALGANAETLIQSGIRFWAYDADPQALASNLATTVTVLKRTLPAPVALDTYVQLNVNQIAAMKTRVGAINTLRISLNNRPAHQLRYTIAFTQPNGSTFLSSVTQYLMVNENDAYVIGFATAPGSAERYAPIFLKCASTFRFLQP